MKRYWTRWQGGRQRRTQAFRDFIKSESAGGLVLFAASAVALILANSALAPGYFAALKTYVGPLSVLHWINDALMAVFFLLVGLEIKREFVEGQLATWPRRLLPGIAAAGGMAVPAAIFFFFNTDNGQTLRGWAIPTATDIAFALGVLALLGPRVPISLKVFLTAVAIIDDLGAVAIIAAFYTSDLSLPWLGLAVATLVLLAGANRIGIKALWPYLAAGAVLWIFVLKSGVHATLAGVALAMVIPLRGASGQEEHEHGPLHTLEHRLHAWVAFLIVPVFGFANAGVALGGVTLASLLAPLPLGIAAGLFLGKQIGVFLAVWASAKLRIAHRPEGATWTQLYGVSLLCGIGFTMSLFIGLLAFPSSVELQDEVKIGVLAGSLLSGAVGALVLFAAGSPKRARRQSAT